jgi:hypothetical protein
LSERLTVTPPAGAAAESVTVQVAVEPETRLAGEHCIDEILGGAVTVMVPPPAVVLREIPAPETAMAFPTGIDTLEPAVEASFTLTLATTPSAIPVAFMPVARQVKVVVPETQLSVLPAAVSTGPAAAVSEVTSVEGYERVHCSPDAAAPPATERFTETEPPGRADPEAKVNEAV